MRPAMRAPPFAPIPTTLRPMITFCKEQNHPTCAATIAWRDILWDFPHLSVNYIFDKFEKQLIRVTATYTERKRPCTSMCLYSNIMKAWLLRLT
mmetsp:Transcript_60131/g.107310  ORF Transcript_60131/g.107310 Transcript_60131/m.107310 type:complete len:94 (-) Transcript_60131:158-439(-)